MNTRQLKALDDAIELAKQGKALSSAAYEKAQYLEAFLPAFKDSLLQTEPPVPPDPDPDPEPEPEPDDPGTSDPPPPSDWTPATLQPLRTRTLPVEIIPMYGGAGGDCVGWSTDNLTVANEKHLTGSRSYCVRGATGNHHPITVNVTNVEGTPYTPFSGDIHAQQGSGGGKWWSRMHQVADGHFDGLYLHDIMKPWEDGHGLYCGYLGNVTVENSLFENLGGQAMQFVNRKRGNEQPDPGPGGLIQVLQCAIYDTGQCRTRGSFPISAYGRNETYNFLLNNVHINNSWPGAEVRSGRTIRSTGALWVGPDFQQDDTPANVWHWGDIIILNADFSVLNSYHPIIQLGNARKVTIGEGCKFFMHGAGSFNYGRIDHDPNWKKSGEVIVEAGWEGNVQLRVGSTHLNPGEAAHFTNGVRDD